MKRLIASALILICLTSLSLAQEMGQKMGDQKEGMMSKGMMMGMEKGMGSHMMGSMMYDMMIQHILMKASALDLTDAQKKELAGIKEKYLYPIVRKEADFKISHMKIMDMIHDPGFDPAKLKSEIKTSNQLSLEQADMMVDALSAVRKTVGTENFTKMMKAMPMECGMMKSGMMMEKGDTMGNEPAQEEEENPPGEHEGHH
ncbi:MAG: hypothetical protein AB1598_00700 [Thermodesulfobacteriota bacterium]